jgi:hypothetical protein
MGRGAVQSPGFWRYLAGVESVDQLRALRRGRILVWSAAPESARGDIVALYGKSPVQAYVALARQCHDPAEGSDGRSWTWLQIQPLVRMLPQARLESSARAREHRGLKKPAGGSYNRIASGPGRGDFLRMLTRSDDVAARRLRGWESGRTRYPTGLSASDLTKAWWEPPETNDLAEHHERRLSEQIARSLVRGEIGRWAHAEGGIDARSIEHPLELEHRRGFADIVLTDARRTRRTLIVVEVKKHARPDPIADPVPQVLRYREALRRKYPQWKVRCIIAAPEFHERTLAAARAERIECLRCDAKGRRLRPA